MYRISHIIIAHDIIEIIKLRNLCVNQTQSTVMIDHTNKKLTIISIWPAIFSRMKLTLLKKLSNICLKIWLDDVFSSTILLFLVVVHYMGISWIRWLVKILITCQVIVMYISNKIYNMNLVTSIECKILDVWYQY